MDSINHFFTYHTHIKLRWLNRPIIDVLTEEFTTNTAQYYIEALNAGAIDVNGNRINPHYRLKTLDIIHHTVHFHEPLVPEIQIIFRHSDFVVVNKPSGVPVHPVGRYFYYSITKALFPNEQVGCVNRLDIPVSGVLIITYKNRKESHQMLETTKKIYVAKVKGLFPEYFEVDKPLGTLNGRVHCIMTNGKPSKTIFRRIEYKNGYSLIECRPITGRTHQIRIHLSHIGFPIKNDILYAKNKDTEKTVHTGIEPSVESEIETVHTGIEPSVESEIEKVLHQGKTVHTGIEPSVDSEIEKVLHQGKTVHTGIEPSVEINQIMKNNNGLNECGESIEGFEDKDKDKYEFIIRTCTGKNNRSFKMKESFICLHAWKYEYNGTIYEAPLPSWAVLH